MKGSTETRTSDITHPDYHLWLANALDQVRDGLPRADELRRGDDISPAIRTTVIGISHILTEVNEELATNYRHEVTGRLAHGPGQRFGTTALCSCAAPLGAALAHLGQIIDRLGFPHQSILQPGTGDRLPAPRDVRQLLQEHLGQTDELLRAAAAQLRGNATQLSRPPAAATPHAAAVSRRRARRA